MAIDPPADEEPNAGSSPGDSFLSLSASSSPAPSPELVAGSVDRYNLNVIARDKVDEILRQAVEETVSAAAAAVTPYAGDEDDVRHSEELSSSESASEDEEEDEDSVIEDNYNNLLVRCDEKVFCADKDIHVSRDVEGFPGNSLESLDGNNEHGKEDEASGDEEEVKADSCGEVLSINETTSAVIVATNNGHGQEGEEEEQDGITGSVTHLSNNELNLDEIDASTEGGNYLSRDTADTFSDRDRDCHYDLNRQSHRSTVYNVITKDADGNSVTDVKGLVGAAGAGVAHPQPELIQMTPDILIKNISVTAEMGCPTSTSHNHIVSGSSSSQFQQESHLSANGVAKQRINCIVKCDSFAPDLLRNIHHERTTAADELKTRNQEDDDYDSVGLQLQHRRQQRRHQRQSRGEHLQHLQLGIDRDSEDNKLLSVSLGGAGAGAGFDEGDNKLYVGGRKSPTHDEQVLGNSISTAANAHEATDAMVSAGCGADILEQRGGSNVLGHRLMMSSTSDTLGAETNNLNNNGIFRRSYTWDQEQQQQQSQIPSQDALLLNDSTRTPRNADLRDVAAAVTVGTTVGDEQAQTMESTDKESNLDFVEGSRQCPSSSSSSTDVMVAMFNGTLWNSSPIDIVGDFEGEIERELGLITGTKSMSSNYGVAPVAVSSHH